MTVIITCLNLNKTNIDRDISKMEMLMKYHYTDICIYISFILIFCTFQYKYSYTYIYTCIYEYNT